VISMFKLSYTVPALDRSANETGLLPLYINFMSFSVKIIHS